MRFSTMALVILLALSTASITASASIDEDTGLVVFLVYADRELAMYDTVDLEVHTLLDGEYVDAHLNVYAGSPTNIVEMTDAATGVRKGTFTITDQLTDTYGGVTVWAEARENLGDEAVVTDSWTIYPVGGNPFHAEVWLDRDGEAVYRPGDEVDIRVGTYMEDNYVTPDEDFYLYVYPPGGRSQRVEIRGFAGMYNGTYRIPGDLTTAGEFQVKVSAQHTFLASSYPREYWRYKDSDSVTFSVRFLDVWANLQDISPSATTFDLHVVDGAGMPVEGAEVECSWEYVDDLADTREGSTSGTTDADGVLEVTVDHEDMGVTSGMVSVTGTVTQDGRHQEFDGSWWPRHEHFPATMEHEGVRTLCLTEQPLGEGDTVVVQQQVFYEGVALVDWQVNYYFANAGGVYGHGNVTTDGEGRFNASVALPQALSDEFERTHLYAYTQFQVEGVWRFTLSFYYLVSQASYFVMDDVVSDVGGEVTVSPFSTGDVVNVELSNFWADGVMERAYLMWGAGEAPDWEAVRDQEWECWTSPSLDDLHTSPMTWDNGSYRASFVCPDLLGPGDRVFVYGLVYLNEPSQGTTTYKGHLTTATLGALNPPPTVTLDNLVEGKAYAGIVKVRGTAADDTSVERVEVQVDGGDWEVATGTDEWTWEFVTPSYGYGRGEHQVVVRAFDGRKYSEVDNVTVVTDQSIDDDDDDSNGSPGPGVAAVIIGMAAAASVLGRPRRNRGSRNP